ncbi:hypothetical protein GGS23DRAFT_45645 [Durotheca rogersii]|uniref:uncharacterized protein n=1 Tax=Durotheca rogersii TaxID=419775 RepID=UPI00221EC630|nr:uncharacterized protein GGS23DRAFT_45645 [Durotheca rogersii]KAI5868683.1 hypothetical protein GGS23DRAFT_45645 [Durotheca rogersii]
MGLRDLIRKKDRLDDGHGTDRETLDRLAGPEFTFIRSDTHTQEIIHPPSDPSERHRYPNSGGNFLSTKDAGSPPSRTRRSLDVFRPRSRDDGTSGDGREGGDGSTSPGGSGGGSGHRGLSERFRLPSSSSSRHAKSEYVPANLPQINVEAAEYSGARPSSSGGGADGRGRSAAGADKDAYEGQWEKRATMLAETNLRQRSRSPAAPHARAQSPAPGGVISSKAIDEQIQEGIRLHEEGDLDQSTRLFGRLADPQGANNPLSQVLYGLALRHGWGCEPDTERAVNYLSAAASNAASVESMALQAGMKKGGAAKGELVLAIFELANCFRHGWGIPRDPVAAKQMQ